MAKSYGVDPNLPDGSDDRRDGDNAIREQAMGVHETLNVDHYMGADAGKGSGYNEDAAGEHKQVTFNAPLGADPSSVVSGVAYTKTDTEDELHYINSADQVKQITKDGQLNIVAADIPNDTIDSQHYAAGSIDLEHMSANSIDSDQYVDGSIDAVHMAVGVLGQSSQAVGTDDIENTTGDWADMANMSITLTTVGRNVLLMFNAFITGSTDNTADLRFDIDGTPHAFARMDSATSSTGMQVSMQWLETSLAAGSHTFKVQWKDTSGTAEQEGSTIGERVLTAVEL